MTPSDAAESDLVLRPGTVDDLHAVHEVYAAAGAGGDYAVDRRSPEEIRAYVFELPARGHDLWLAERDDEVLGFIGLRGPWVSLLFVHPDHARSGVGSALLELATALRPDGFGLRVHQANTAALAFYRRHGLVELERTDGSSYADGSPDLQMAWLGEDPLAYLRGRIDEVDDELAVLLARRAALTAAVQDHKEVGGEAGRDPDREAEIVDRMAAHVPGLSPERIAAVMHTVIAQSLAAWEERS